MKKAFLHIAVLGAILSVNSFMDNSCFAQAPYYGTRYQQVDAGKKQPDSALAAKLAAERAAAEKKARLAQNYRNALDEYNQAMYVEDELESCMLLEAAYWDIYSVVREPNASKGSLMLAADIAYERGAYEEAEKYRWRAKSAGRGEHGDYRKPHPRMHPKKYNRKR